MYWLEVSVLTDEARAESVAAVLRPFAYSDGVVLEQLGDISTPAPDVLETAVTVKFYLPANEDTPAKRRQIELALHQLGQKFSVSSPLFCKLEEQDWANAWKAHYHPFRIGQRFWIQPSWLNAADAQNSDLQADDLVLTLDPGMAFGTGLHPTTQMCLQVLEQVVAPGRSVLDVGTGSGILAIAAAKLGARPILAVDNDALAVETAVVNARLNQMEDALTVQVGTLSAVAVQTWDVVVANILAPVIVAMLQDDTLMDYVAPEGHLVLSGIVVEQGDDVETAVQQAGGEVQERRRIDDWLAYLVRRRSGNGRSR